jgi:hypothetical protein
MLDPMSRRPGAGPRRATSARWVALAAVLLLVGCQTRNVPESNAWLDSIPEAYRLSTAALGWPGATRAFQVTPGGDIDQGAWRVSTRPSADGAPATAPRVIAFEQRWLPVAHWLRVGGRETKGELDDVAFRCVTIHVLRDGRVVARRTVDLR